MDKAARGVFKDLYQNPHLFPQLTGELDKADSEASLYQFIQLAWHILEPGRVFVPNWHIEAICDHLEAVTRGDINRLLMNVIPGGMKSLTTEVFWPMWEWGPKGMPSTRYVSGSYSEALTVRDNRKARNLVNSEWYRGHWGDVFQLDPEQNTKTNFANTETGFKLATSVGGLGTGERGDRFIIDDPHNVKDGESEAVRDNTIEWFKETVTTRVNDPEKSAIVVIMQRVHGQDVSGEILAEEMGYHHLMLPMEFEENRRCFTIVPPSYSDVEPQEVVYDKRAHAWKTELPEDDEFPVEYRENAPTSVRYNADPRTEEEELLWKGRHPRAVVDRDKTAMGSYATAGQYQQRPAPRGGGMFQREWFTFVDAAPVDAVRVRGWDLASTTKKKSPWTVGVRMSRARDGMIYIEHCLRLRGTPGQVEQAILNMATQDPQLTRISIPQDPGQAALSQKKTMINLLIGFDVHFSPESGDKETRAIPLSAQAEAGNVKVVRGEWNGIFFDELCTFPKSVYKDQVDAASRAFQQLIPKKQDHVPAGGFVVELAQV